MLRRDAKTKGKGLWMLMMCSEKQLTKLMKGEIVMDNTFEQSQQADELVVLWTSGDREVALKMIFMYTFNSKTKGWWEDVCLIVWGPSSKLLTEDKELQEYVARMLEAGIEVVACKACTDSYGISDEVEKLGIEVKFMGQPLTHMLKRNSKLITF